MKNLKKIQLKKLKLRIELIALLLMLTLSGCGINKKDKKQGIKDVITTEADNTYFDDFMLDEFEKELISLEEYLELSNELHKLIGKKYTISDESLKNEQLKSPKEIRELIEKYNNNKKDVDVLKDLKVQASLANIYLKTDGYNILANALLYALKIEIVDAYGFDKDISNQILEQIVVPGFNEMNFGDVENRKDAINIGDNSVTLSVEFQNILSRIYKLQDDAGKENTRGYNYHKDRNELLEESFDMLEGLIEKESKFTQLKIK